MRYFVVVLALVVLVALPAGAIPQYYQFNLAALGKGNADANAGGDSPYGYWGGGLFSQGSVTASFTSPTIGAVNSAYGDAAASVPFTIGTGGGANESWSGAEARIGQPPLTPQQLDLDTNVRQASAVFLLLNTFWGVDGASGARIDVVLTFASSATVTYGLFGNSDVRDHNYSLPLTYTNTINSSMHNTGGTYRASVNQQQFLGQILGGGSHDVRRDAIALFIDPAFWGDTLIKISILDNGGWPGEPNGPSTVWLWGATVSSVPEPSTYMMMGAGMALIGLRLRRRR
ncbi:MAG: PEP-CTERM sorting domain-containing protein [Candidatus Solibacter usitatus]|nr:PEP-CTERM sorting domain-containing protein [Candidatus Solibacter usitatus]